VAVGVAEGPQPNNGPTRLPVRTRS
jgi:hypothetical protein